MPVSPPIVRMHFIATSVTVHSDTTTGDLRVESTVTEQEALELTQSILDGLGVLVRIHLNTQEPVKCAQKQT